MAQQSALAAEPRALEGKSALTRLRREGKIPGVVYGKSMEATAIQLDGKTFDQYMKRHGASGIVDLQLTGDRAPAVIKEVQRDPISGRVLHLDLQRISMQDQITSAVPLALIGDTSAVTTLGGMIEQPLTELSVNCQADRLPEQITVDISGLLIGHTITVADLVLPDGVETAQSPDTVIAAATMTSAGRGIAAAEAATEE